VELKHLQALVGIADTGSFSAAGELLGTVQSNISGHVARLERELGVELVDRSSGRPTAEGQVVVARARRILVELEALVTDVMAMGREVKGTVRVGMIGTAGRWLVPLLVDELRQRFPGVQMTFADGTSTTLEPRLVSGQLDVAVVTLPLPGEELSASPLFEEDLMLVVARTDPLALAHLDEEGRPLPLPVSLLGELELLLPIPGTALREEIDAAVHMTGVLLRPSLELDGLRMIASLCFDGFGPAILPAAAVPSHLRDRFALFPIEGSPRRRVGVAVRSRGLPSASTRSFIEVLQAVVANDALLPEGLHPTVTRRR
jgi:DNA-binding transcriptional LysR family regulator